jgi:alpha-L-rhamnosidase
MRQLSCFLTLSLFFLTNAVYSVPIHLRCEYRENPLGIDSAIPRFSWQNTSPERNWHQMAYQILVAHSPENLKNGNADVWDSGKLNSEESVAIPYAGPALESRKRYYWTVRVWDSNGRRFEAVETAWWEMGLLKKSDWSAKWISWTDPLAVADRARICWIWAGRNALQARPAEVVHRPEVVVFRTAIRVRKPPRDAALFVLARGDFQVEVNGHKVGAKKGWHEFDREDITDQLKRGKNSIEVTVTASESYSSGSGAQALTPSPAFAGLIKITPADGSIRRIPTDAKWKSRGKDASWEKSVVLSTLDDPDFKSVPPLPTPAAMLRHSFAVGKSVRSARLYVTALGSYRAFLNGQRIGVDVLTPGFTDYSKRIQYQTYDVTSLITSGRNVLAAVLGGGWFASGMAMDGLAYFFQPPPIRFLAQLEVDYLEGNRETIASDESWKVAESPILHAEIYSGEFYDARQEIPHWAEPSFDDSRWQEASLAPEPASGLVGQPDTPVRIIQTLTPKMVTPVGKAYIFDMGQNMAGWARLQVTGPSGTRVHMRFAERLNDDGSIYTENLRNADATDIYVLRGAGPESYAPSFTFHGFRYVEVTGFPGIPTSAAITGEVASSVAEEPAAKVTTASDLVNRMWGIGIWGQRGNFLSIPTDCPQRDERLGWMGDAGAFWRTGTYNFNIEAFSHKFMHDVTDAQTAAGDFTDVSPDSLRPFDSEGAPGWADAGVIIPWTTWLQYADREIIEENWDSMQRFMDFTRKKNPNFLRKNGVGHNYADWLAPDDRTDKDLLATAYWALCTKMMSQMAQALGREEETKRYSELFDQVREAFQKAYIRADGQVGTGTQTSYVVALYAGMAPAKLEQSLVDNLVRDIESRGWHLSTGFLGTPFLLATLADHGRSDVAYRLLLNETYPSWGYMVSKGATTWWERWNGDVGDPAMNSYNHYAFGSVVAWVYRYLVGIDTASDGPGFQHIIIHPHPHDQMDHASGEYASPYGEIATDWMAGSGTFSLRVEIPANTYATIYLPLIPNTHLWESGAPVEAQRENASYIVQTGSGLYHFEVK